MKISFNNQDMALKTERTDRAVSGQTNSAEKSGTKNVSVIATLGNPTVKSKNNLFPGENGKNKNGKTLTELMQEAGAVDVSVDQNYRTVLSNTMSAEDYARAQEEGFDYYSMDQDEVVTIQDRIKAEVAKGGEMIIGYNDDLSGAKLTEALGSETLARSIQNTFGEANLPITDDNIAKIAKAWEQASQITEPNDAQLAYLLDNELNLDIWGLYLAENSGNVAGRELTDMPVDLSDKNNEKLLLQVKDILKQVGYESEEDMEIGLTTAQWLLDRELPVTVDTFKTIDEIRDMDLPITEEKFAEAVKNAVSKGIDPIKSKPGKEEETVAEKAVRLEEYWFSQEPVSVIRDRRTLEEIRLSMTAEVNIRLLESDFEIDTAPIEEFIEALKTAEKEVAAKYFPDDKESEEKQVSGYRLMNEVNRAVSDIRETPAAGLGMYVSRSVSEVTVSEFRSEGLRLKDTYERAGESYEALMTAPRADLGDSIKKAFSNISSLADQIGIEKSDDNLRAIRILGYNNMEISISNVQKIASADSLVRGVIDKMTPASVLGMIRDGINPLETSFAELNTYFDAQQTGGYEETAKNYSEFLYGLEMQDNITPEERESYIGIYRLIHQIEKADGAAIGTVLNEQAVLSFENLLSAARTRRINRVDVRVNESFGGTADILKTGISITEQIATAYKAERYATEADELRSAANVGREAAGMLENYGIPGSAENLLAMESLIENENDLYREMSKYEEGKRRVKESAEKMDDLLGADDFDKVYDEENGKLESLARELTMSAENYIDVKAMSLVHRQISLSMRISETSDPLGDRDYIIPMEFGGEISKVHISFRNEGSEPGVTISTRIGEDDIEAYFGLSKDSLEGYVVQNSENALKKMQTAVDIFSEALKADPLSQGITMKDIPVVSKDKQFKKAQSVENENSRSKDAEAENSDGSERKYLLQVTRHFLQAVGSVQ